MSVYKEISRTPVSQVGEFLNQITTIKEFKSRYGEEKSQIFEKWQQRNSNTFYFIFLYNYMQA